LTRPVAARSRPGGAAAGLQALGFTLRLRQGCTIACMPTGTAAAVEARGLRKSFGGNIAVDGLDLHVAAGSVLALIGPNGSGKPVSGL
jgi:ABC-2 type transport system ATP-binding protein